MENNSNSALKSSNTDKIKLIIDFGNTLTKVAVFQYDNIIFLERVQMLTTDFLKQVKDRFLPVAAIISSVIDVPGVLIEYLKSNFLFFELDHSTLVPVKNLYKTPETLGKDRLAAVVGASSLFPGVHCLVIDAGTCITFDFIDKSASYYGGSISPGISLRFKALHNFTGRLPFVTQSNFEGLTGATTEESILSGVLNGTVAELEEMIRQYCILYPDIKVVITGGDMNYFDKRLKSNIFAVQNLVLIGLNVILDFNVR